MSRSIRTFLIAALFAIQAGAASTASAAHNPTPSDSRKPSPITLRYKYKQGQVLQYHAVIKATGYTSAVPAENPDGEYARRSTSFTIDLTMTQRVTAVRPDGTAELECLLESIALNIDGITTSDLPGRAMRTCFLVSPTGTITSADSDGNDMDRPVGNVTLRSESLMALLSGLVSPSVPSQPVAAGDTWRHQADPAALVANASMLLRLVDINRTEPGTADIAFRMPMKGSFGSIVPSTQYDGALEGHASFSVSDGHVTRQNATFYLSAGYIVYPASDMGGIFLPMRMALHGRTEISEVPIIHSIQRGSGHASHLGDNPAVPHAPTSRNTK